MVQRDVDRRSGHLHVKGTMRMMDLKRLWSVRKRSSKAGATTIAHEKNSRVRKCDMCVGLMLCLHIVEQTGENREGVSRLCHRSEPTSTSWCRRWYSWCHRSGEKIAEVMRALPQERIHEHIAEQTVLLLVPQIGGRGEKSRRWCALCHFLTYVSCHAGIFSKLFPSTAAFASGIFIA